MVWVKRILPLVVLIATWFYVDYYYARQAEEYDQLSRKQALATARVWNLSARFREEPQTFLTLRDSVLIESGLTLDQMHQYLQLYSDRPEKYETFARLVSYYVDSLVELRDHYEGTTKELQDSLSVSPQATPGP